MNRDEKSYYAWLHLSPDASMEEVKRNYRRLSRNYHPDANKGDKWAADTFKDLNTAYEVLSDENKRRSYDPSWKDGTSGPEWEERPSSPPPPRPRQSPPPRPTPPPKQSQTPPPRPTTQPTYRPASAPVGKKQKSHKKAVIFALCALAAIGLISQTSGHGKSAAQQVAKTPGVQWAVDGSSYYDLSEDDGDGWGTHPIYYLGSSTLFYSAVDTVGLDRTTGNQQWLWEKTDCAGHIDPTFLVGEALMGEANGYLWFHTNGADGTCRLNNYQSGYGEFFPQVNLSEIHGNIGVEKISVPGSEDNLRLLSIPSLSSLGILKNRCWLHGCFQGYTVIPGAIIRSDLHTGDYGNTVDVDTVLMKAPNHVLWHYKTSTPLELLDRGYNNRVLLFNITEDSLSHNTEFDIALDRQTGKKLWSGKFGDIRLTPAGKFWLFITPVKTYYACTPGPSTCEKDGDKITVVNSETGRTTTVRFDQKQTLYEGDPRIIATRGGKNPQAVFRTDEGNWRVYLRTAKAIPLTTSAGNMSYASFDEDSGSFLEAGDQRNLIVLKKEGSSRVLMSVQW